ncbi:unnamed protein product [Trichogramma brassicae]|uniref:Uncharacterized protein n=1 Tax=Trichogramma brassicae TaxID=86971 RepID=A0A6H5IF71_9HYME|nr:unnamed protein product [Trichogramma brassicae]
MENNRLEQYRSPPVRFINNPIEDNDQLFENDDLEDAEGMDSDVEIFYDSSDYMSSSDSSVMDSNDSNDNLSDFRNVNVEPNDLMNNFSNLYQYVNEDEANEIITTPLVVTRNKALLALLKFALFHAISVSGSTANPQSLPAVRQPPPPARCSRDRRPSNISTTAASQPLPAPASRYHLPTILRTDRSLVSSSNAADREDWWPRDMLNPINNLLASIQSSCHPSSPMDCSSFTPEQLELQQELDALNEVMMRNPLETPMSEENSTNPTERTTDLTIDDTTPTRPSMTEWCTPMLIDMEEPTFSNRRR